MRCDAMRLDFVSCHDMSFVALRCDAILALKLELNSFSVVFGSLPPLTNLPTFT